MCFDDDGTILWRFNRENGGAFIDDCYAMNATRDELWIYYYSDFSVCRVGMDFSQKAYSVHEIAGSHALVVSEAAILLSSQYQEPSATFYLLRRIEDRLTMPRKLTAHLPDGRPFDAAKIIGRGSTLNVLNEEGWFQACLSDLL